MSSDTLSADRRRAMLRTAMGPTIATALADPAVIEIMVNPDGALRLDRLGEGRTDTGTRYDPAQIERIIHLVASHARTEVNAASPIVSAELPPHGEGAGERFEGEVRVLSSAETLTYLHGTISSRRHPVALPDTPMYLDGILADTPLIGGLERMLGHRHLRTLTVIGFPNVSRTDILDALNEADFPYRWVTRFIALDKTDATKLLTKIRRQWFNKRKSITAMLREIMYNQSAQLLDSDADNDREAVETKIRQVERIAGGLGFTTIRDGVNAVEAWLSSLPGLAYANVRQPIIHTLNLAHLMLLSSMWAGPTRNGHLDAPPVLTAQTAGSTPFRLSTHVGDVGHMMVVGPTGAGKSVLLALV